MWGMRESISILGGLRYGIESRNTRVICVEHQSCPGSRLTHQRLAHQPYRLDRTERKQVAARKHGAPRRTSLRRFLRSHLHLLTFAIIHIFFSLYIRIRQAYHAVVAHVISVFAYHHNTPELIQRDVKNLRKIPHHLSVILKLEDQGRGAGLETLMNEVSDIAAWCACAGVPVLSVYEKTGGAHLKFNLLLRLQITKPP